MVMLHQTLRKDKATCQESLAFLICKALQASNKLKGNKMTTSL